MRSAAQALVETLSDGRRHTLPDQGHDISAGAVSAALEAFLSD
jgi:hypothetical protein